MLQAPVSQRQENVAVFRPENANLHALVAAAQSEFKTTCARPAAPVATRTALNNSDNVHVGTVLFGRLQVGQNQRGQRGQTYGQTAKNGSTTVVAHFNCRKPFPPLFKWQQCVVTGWTRR